MFGLSRSVTLALVGWLWADILLGLFVIFLAAASTPIQARQQDAPSLDPKPLELTLQVDGAALLGSDGARLAAEQQAFIARLKEALAAKTETRRLALVFAYGVNQDPSAGERMAKRVSEALEAQYQGIAVQALHDIKAGDAGSAVALQIYFYR